jgi:pimeloyl-ACP methyl ester carboxylesterase
MKTSALIVPVIAGLLLDVGTERDTPPAMSASTMTVMSAAAAQAQVSFPARDGWVIHALLHGDGDRGVVLAHGGRFNKESWQQQAMALVNAGFRVLAIDLRGYGQSQTGPPGASPDSAHLDVLAAVSFLRRAGVRTVAVVGASMGADAAAGAAVASGPGEIDRLVLLAGSASEPAARLKGRKLFIVSRGDLGPSDIPRLPAIRKQYEAADGPKELLILEGNAHAQFLFASDQGEPLLQAILRFLLAR